MTATLPITIRGVVQRGSQRGRTLGYPTANISLHRALRDGIYVAYTKIGERWYPSVAFVGAAKTFQENEKRLETHILDATMNLYDTVIAVRLVRRLRGNKAFVSVDHLIQAMKEDEANAREFFKKH